MTKQLTITVPDGYDADLSHIVLVSTEHRNSGQWGAPKPIYAAVVLDAAGETVQEVGEGPLSGLLTDAARIIRTGTAVRA